MKPQCLFHKLGDCDGILQRAHWIPKQRLRRAGLTEDEVWDRRAWTPICQRHHHQLDHRFLNAAFPDDLREFAAEHHFFFAGTRGWVSGQREQRKEAAA